jgi:hypothetical protein
MYSARGPSPIPSPNVFLTVAVGYVFPNMHGTYPCWEREVHPPQAAVV